MITRWMSGSAAVLALGIGPAHALTATEAWEAWKGWAESTGGTITVTGETQGIGSLLLTGVTLSVDAETSGAVVDLGDMAFNEAPDGSVEVAYPESYVARFTDTSAEAVEGELTVNTANPALSMTEAEVGIDFVFTADVVEYSIDNLVVEGEPAPFDMTATLQSVVSNYSTDPSVSFLDFALNAAAIDFSIAAEDPETDGALEAVISFADLASSGSGVNIAAIGAQPEDLGAALAEGFSLDFAVETGAGNMAMNFAEPGETFQMTADIGGNSGRFALDQTRMLSESRYDGLALTASGSSIPFPQVTAALGEFTTNLLVPLLQGEPAQDFGLRMVLGDLTIGEEIWSLFDVAGALPRDPATVLIDLAGKATILADLFDEATMMSADAPGQIESLTLNDLQVTVAGAELTGTGAFTFDNTDLSTFNGMPAPDGSIDLSLSGGNGLLDTLVTMGLVPQEQAMGARMMMGMLAVPGDGPDTLTSEIAVRPDGSVLANGTPLPFF